MAPAWALDLRDKLLANRRFQRWAAGTPFTRRIARREARALFDLCAGFVYAQTLRACVELNLFEHLATGPQHYQTLAARCTLPEPSMRLLLQAAAALRLLQTAGADTYRLGPLGAALRGNPGIAAMVMHHQLLYADLADPLALLRRQHPTALSQFWPYAGAPGQTTAYSQLMAASQPMIAGEILDRYNFAHHAQVLDAGGGDGSFLRALAPHAPKLALALFDLPAVTAAAAQAFAAAGLTARTTITAGDFTQDPLPPGADLITLIRVLHDHDDAAVLALLRAAHTALPPHGTLLIAEPLAGTAKAEPVGAAYFGFYLFAMGSGRPRTFAELEALLHQAGFSRIRAIPTRQPMLTGLIIARV